MRYLLVFGVLILSVTLTKVAADRVCLEETDDEICESFHLQCGVTVYIEDACGKKRYVECMCPPAGRCSLETLKCE